MKTLFFFLFFCVVALGHSFAGTPSAETVLRVRTLTLGGLEHAYNFDFTTADKLFDEAIAIEPRHPRPYVGKSFLALWKFLLTKNDSDYQSFLSLADRSVETGERYLDMYGEDAEAMTCLGMMYGYRAFAHGRAKSYLKAAWDGKKSYDYLCDALKLNPNTYDAYLGFGIFHYFTSFMPKPMRWIVSILGITGDSDLGLRELRVAAEKGTYAKVEARYYLAQFLPWQEGDFTASEKILTDLLSQYPDNSLLMLTLAAWEIRREDIIAAENHLTTIVQRQTTPINGIQPLAMYKLAECKLNHSSYDEARVLYQKFLDVYNDEMYSATSNYRIGVCYEMTGQRKLALPFYKRAAVADRSFGDDAYSARKAGIRLKLPLSTADTILLQAQNALKSGAYDPALSLFTSIASLPDASSEILAEAIFGIGESLFKKGLYAEALQKYQRVITASPKEEFWLLPWSYYQSALCDLKLGHNDTARKAFEKVKEYDNYDFKNWLSFRTERELLKLSK